MRARTLLPVAVLLLASTARAQEAPPPAAAFAARPKPNPAEGISLQLEDADLGELVRTIGEITGKRFVIASPKLAKVKASVFAPQKVSVAEAYQAFLAVLGANGLTVVPQAGFYKIVESQDVARQLTPIERGDLPKEERYVTRIHRVAHLPAEDVATNLLSKLATKDASIVPYGSLLVITETAANLRRMLDVLEVVDQGGDDDKVWLRPVMHLPASQVEKQLTEILGIKGGAAAATGSTTGDAGLHVGRIVALDRPNAVVVVGTRVSYERVERLLDMIDVAPSNEMKMQVVLLQHADAKKIVGPINDALGAAGAAGAGAPAARGAAASPPAAALEAQVKVSADETSNALIVTATPRDFVHVREVIRQLDRAKRQVFIEAAILDLSSDSGLDVGVAWHGGHQGDAAVGPDGKTQTTYGGFRSSTSGGFPSQNDLQAFALGVRGPEIPFLSGKTAETLGLTSIPSFGLFLSALATQKGADILSTPSIMASDNTAAEIKVQLRTSLQPNAPQLNTLGAGLATGAGAGSPLAGFGASGGNVSANYTGIGPRVKVTPHLNESDDVRLDVEEVISDIQSAPSATDTFGTISYLERTALTTLTVKNGQTIVIGGLVRNRMSRQDKKVPLLGDIPLLGALFRTRSEQMEKSNLVLVLTPHIIRDEADMRRIFERKMQERQEMIDHDMVFRGVDWTPPKDWHLTRGLVAHIRASYVDLERRRREDFEANQVTEAAPPATPIDLPVPQTVTPAGATAGTPAAPKTETPKPALGGVPVRPPILER